MDVPTTVIKFDESGFTGANLLDPVQPVFSIASTDLSDSEADDLLLAAFGPSKARELKFSTLWNRQNRSGFLRFSKSLADLGGDRVCLYVADKRFALFTKLVDSLIEPYLSDAGYDFYDDGFCWKYANYLFFGFSQAGDTTLLDALLAHYQAFSRAPSVDSLALLQFQLSVMANSTEEPPSVFLKQMATGARIFTQYHDVDRFRGSNDIQVSSMIAVLARWRQRRTEDFAVVHDASSNFMRSRDLWDRITSSQVPEQEQRLGDGSFVDFPLRVVSTEAVNSENSKAVQFCDLLAGIATKRYASNPTAEDQELFEAMLSVGLQTVEFIPLMPSGVFPDKIPPKLRTGPDAVDRFADIMFGAHHAPRKP